MASSLLTMSRRMQSLAHKNIFQTDPDEGEKGYDYVPSRYSKNTKNKVGNKNRKSNNATQYIRHTQIGNYNPIMRSNSTPQMIDKDDSFIGMKNSTKSLHVVEAQNQNNDNDETPLTNDVAYLDNGRQSPETQDNVEDMYVGSLSPTKRTSLKNFGESLGSRSAEESSARGRDRMVRSLIINGKPKSGVQTTNADGGNLDRSFYPVDDFENSLFREITTHVLDHGGTDQPPGYTSYDLISRSLHQIAREGNHKLLALALGRLGDQVPRRINQLDEDLLAPLHYAARYAHPYTVIELLQKKAKVDIRGQDDLTPLHFAARYRRPIRKKTDIGGNKDLEKDEDLSVVTTGSTVSLNGDAASVIRILVDNGASIDASDVYGQTALHYAAMRGNDVAARDLLSYGYITVDARDQQLMTPLFLAATFGYTDVCEQLIERGADIIAMDVSQQTALHKAAAEGHQEIVELLLSAAMKQGGDNKVRKLLSMRDNNRQTPLYVAVINGHIETTRYLLDEDADVNVVRDTLATPLHAAAAVGDRDLIILLLQYGAYVDPADTNQQTPLHKAAAYNQCEAIEVLLDSHAKIEKRDKDSFTPLLLAVSAGHAKAVQILMDRGARVDVVDKDDKSAVFWCAKQGHQEALRALLKSPEGSDLIDLSDRFDDSPLHEAAHNGYINVLEVLLSHGSKVDNKNEDAETALHIAAKQGQTEVVKQLVRKYRNLICDNNEKGNTPLHLASLAGKEDAVRTLLEANASVEARNAKLWTPLDCAAANGHAKVCSLLVQYGAQLNPIDKTKTTPLQLAAQRGHVSVTRLLLELGANVSVLDRSQRNALELAIASSHRDVAMTIIKSRNWLSAAKNCQLDADGRRITPLRLLIRQFPDVAKAVLDRCITTNGRDSDQPEYGIKVNFELLDDTYTVHNVDETESKSYSSYSNDSPFDEEGKLLEYAEVYTHDARHLKQNHPLSLMVKYKRSELLSHPVTVFLLKHKWKSYARYVYYANLLLYSVFLFFLTAYVVTSVDWKYALYLIPAKEANSNTTIPSCSELAKSLGLQPSYFTTSSKWVIIIMALISIAKEIFQFYQARLNYIGIENLLEWVCYIGAILLVFDWGPEECSIRQVWQWEVGAVVIFFAWMNLVLFLRKLPFFGIYIVMFTDVLRTFCQFFVIFLLFIVGFALSFFMLFRTQEHFADVGKSLMKTTVMMIGEIEYEALFEEFDLQYPVISNILFAVFLIVMSLLIMNLLIGLAVDDIKGVQEQAILTRRTMQTQLILDVEVMIPDGLRRLFAIPWKKYFPNIQHSYFRKLFFDSSPFQFDDTPNSTDQGNEVKELREKIEALIVQISSMKNENEQIINLLQTSTLFQAKGK